MTGLPEPVPLDQPPGDPVALAELVEAGQLTPALDRTFPLAEAADAIEYLLAGRARGKIAVTV